MLSIEKQSWLPSSLTSDRNNYSWLGCWACVYFVRACSLVTPLLMQLCFCLLVSVPPDPPWGMHFKWSGKGETCLAVFEAGHLPHGRLCHELSTNPPPTQSGHVLMILPVHCQFLLLKKKSCREHSISVTQCSQRLLSSCLGRFWLPHHHHVLVYESETRLRSADTNKDNFRVLCFIHSSPDHTD